CARRDTRAQRLATARFGETTHHAPIVGVQENDLAVDALPFELFDRPQKVAQETALSNVDAQRHALKRSPRLRAELRHFGKKRQGEIIHAEKSEILKTIDCLGFPRPRHAGDDPEKNLFFFHEDFLGRCFLDSDDLLAMSEISFLLNSLAVNSPRNLRRSFKVATSTRTAKFRP